MNCVVIYKWHSTWIEQVFIYSCRQCHVFMRINPKVTQRLTGTDCIFFTVWGIADTFPPQKIERKQEERPGGGGGNGWVHFWVTAWSVSQSLFWFVFSRIWRRVLWVICVQWRERVLKEKWTSIWHYNRNKKYCNTLWFPHGIPFLSLKRQKQFTWIFVSLFLQMLTLPQISKPTKQTLYASIPITEKS